MPRRARARVVPRRLASRALATSRTTPTRYTGADVLHRRTKKRILGRLEKGGDLTVSRRLFLRPSS